VTAQVSKEEDHSSVGLLGNKTGLGPENLTVHLRMMEVSMTQTINKDQTRGETVSKAASHMLIFQFFLS
jgi:hypothetical protein